jgi:hypothetical protein
LAASPAPAAVAEKPATHPPKSAAWLEAEKVPGLRVFCVTHRP